MAKDAELLKERADRIRGLRRMARVSQETAAQNIGVSVRGYAEWEAGRGGINDENLKALARYYGTSPDYIEYGIMKRDTPDPFTGTVDSRLDAIEQKLEELRINQLALLAAIQELPRRQPSRTTKSRSQAS